MTLSGGFKKVFLLSFCFKVLICFMILVRFESAKTLIPPVKAVSVFAPSVYDFGADRQADHYQQVNDLSPCLSVLPANRPT